MRRRPVFALLATAVVSVTVAACGAHTQRSAPPPPPRHAPVALAKAPATTVPSATTTTTKPPRPKPARPAAPPATLVATLKGTTPASTRPGGPAVAQVPGSWYGYPSILPVIARTTGWVEVREAQRPNESTAWVPTADVKLSVDPYFLMVSLPTEHLQMYEHGQLMVDVPVGIGLPTSPTVPGQFFIAMKAPPPNSAYGPFVLVTSDHSNTFTDWEGSGDGIIAIHGPIDAEADAEIGTTGARVSNGCIRLHVADLVKLANVPAGTPLTIVG